MTAPKLMEENEGSSSKLLYFSVWNTCTYPIPPKNVEIVVSNDETLASLKEKIGEKLSYPVHSFKIEKFNELPPETPVSQIHKESFSKLIISRSSESQESDFPKPESTMTTVHLKETSSSTTRPATPSNAIVPYQGPVSAAGFSIKTPRTENSFSYYDLDKKSETNFVGLSNQGATCYMNSLIQTLYMTPEFRRALYKWDFEQTFQSWLKNEGKDVLSHEEKENLRKEREKSSIPYQLQLLFSRLQLREQRDVKTKDLTNSFGWKESDAFTQHDVQELCRVLFDALEKVLKGTEQEHLINQLYQGEWKDYVKCKECEYESSRVDKFLDIPLVIRGFGSTTAIGSVEEAIEKFIQAETLDGENQYHCEKCKKKVDAIKGLKFTKFPYLLSLQLKRFDFDYETLRRIKINDRVTFPFLLDLNSYLDVDADSIGEKPKKRKRSDHNQADGKVEAEQLNWDEQVQKFLENGPYVYELFSVLVHRGSALGGHYYAYIKALDQHKWYEFNDSHVEEISEYNICKAFGEDTEGSYSMNYWSSSANAYMLMYRQIDPKLNKLLPSNDEVPAKITEIIQDENKKYWKKREEKRREREMVNLKVHYRGLEKSWKVHNGQTLMDVLEESMEQFNISDMFSSDCIRFVSIDGVRECYGLEELNTSLDDLRFYSSKSLLLETKNIDEEFPAHNYDDKLIQIIIYDSKENNFQHEGFLPLKQKDTLEDLKKILEKKFHIPSKEQRIIKEEFSSFASKPWTILEDDDSLSDVYDFSKIYVEHDDQSPDSSPSCKEIERMKNLIKVQFNLPGNKECDQTIQANKKITIRELKKLMEPIVGIPSDEFKLLRYPANWNWEIQDETSTLEDQRFMDGFRVCVEKGRPLKKGEHKLNFCLLDISDGAANEVTELFEMIVDEEIQVYQLKQLLSKKLIDEKNINIVPERMRLRELQHRSPSTVCINDKKLKECTSLYGGKNMAIQTLEEEETVQSEDDLPLFLQQWYPSEFKLGSKIEMIFHNDMKIEEFKELISKKFQIKNVGIAKTSIWPSPDLLDVPELDWDRSVPDYEIETIKRGTLDSAPYYLRAGDIVLFRNNEEELRELSKEERMKIERESTSRRRNHFYMKEEALQINVRE